MAVIKQPVTSKRYGGERLYDTRSASYVSLADLEDEEQFIVVDVPEPTPEVGLAKEPEVGKQLAEPDAW